MTRLFLFAVLSAVVITGCATEPVEPQEAPATEAEKDRAVKDFTDCVKSAAPRLDDHVSDARVIGEAIISGPCAKQTEALVETTGRGSNWRVKAMVRNDIENRLAPDTATQVVLIERKNLEP